MLLSVFVGKIASARWAEEYDLKTVSTRTGLIIAAAFLLSVAQRHLAPGAAETNLQIVLAAFHAIEAPPDKTGALAKIHKLQKVSGKFDAGNLGGRGALTATPPWPPYTANMRIVGYPGYPIVDPDTGEAYDMPTHEAKRSAIALFANDPLSWATKGILRLARDYGMILQYGKLGRRDFLYGVLSATFFVVGCVLWYRRRPVATLSLVTSYVMMFALFAFVHVILTRYLFMFSFFYYIAFATGGAAIIEGTARYLGRIRGKLRT